MPGHGRPRPASRGAGVRGAGRDATREGAVQRSCAGVVLAPEGRGIFPSLTIEENLALHLKEKDQRDAVYERFTGLADRRGVVAGSLSGGEQQLLALAPLLQRPPKVLIADEPSLGLAPRVVDEVFRLLVELRDHGTALLLVEEKAAEILGVADTVAYLAQGRVSWCGPRSEVRADRLTEAYLGMAAGGTAAEGVGQSCRRAGAGGGRRSTSFRPPGSASDSAASMPSPASNWPSARARCAG
ncbi:ATP-binding cassette domain-containing protein [Streptomyces sp. NPDC059002]|uniref:ATP-binding cassette domain-containing protein n=1 Tax=Streptomyces sp. NPDC059002 TaxID=3346690 RepID=UPI00369C0D69